MLMSTDAPQNLLGTEAGELSEEAALEIFQQP